MELLDATEKSPATTGIDPGTFRLVAKCLKQYAVRKLKRGRNINSENNIKLNKFA